MPKAILLVAAKSMLVFPTASVAKASGGDVKYTWTLVTLG
jgi:hypothetical protein